MAPLKETFVRPKNGKMPCEGNDTSAVVVPGASDDNFANGPEEDENPYAPGTRGKLSKSPEKVTLSPT